MNWKEKLAESKKLYDQAKAILGNEEATAEEKEQVEPLMEDAKRLRAEAGQLKEVEMNSVELDAEVEKLNKEDGETKTAPKKPSGFKDWNEFIVAVAIAGHRNLALRKKDPRLVYFKDQVVPTERKDLVESVGASGGFLVPTEFQAQLQAVMGESSIARPRATIIRMRRRQINLPVLDQTGTTSGIGHWFGGMQAYWTEEATQKTESQPAFRQIELVAHKLVLYTEASDELLDDSAISLSDFLSGPLGFAGAVAWHEDYAFLRGTGAGQPLGIINAGATITVARAADGAIGFADLANMMENFLPTGRGVWVITQSAMSELIQLNGPAGNPSYIWQPNARDGVPGSLLGFPVIFSEKNPILGVTGDVALIDWRYYLIGDRQATTVESTQYAQWQYDLSSFRCVARVDGQPWMSAPFTLTDGSSQVSPFVILGTKST